MAFPKIFFKGKFDYMFPCEYYLIPTKYFNQRLLNFLPTFALNSDYKYFVNEQIIIAMRQVTDRLIVGMFANYEKSAKHFL